MEYTYNVEAGNYALAGEASSSIKALLKKLGISGDIVRRMAIAAYEAEMNIVIHSKGGCLILKISPEELILISEDRGPGIPDIDLAMKEGYSTAPDEAREMGFGAGMGLSNMKRCADEFNIKSTVGIGTKVQIKIYLK
ncbi:MAG TPA: anti-sigma regulatory factor [Clostridiales bacterium]|nr:anti-sigma regulatory factor [Clostridiales bacterium]